MTPSAPVDPSTAVAVTGPVGGHGDAGEFPALDRLRSDEAVLAGVACRVGARLGADVILVRVSFVVLAAAVGFGVVAYGVLALLFVGRSAPTGRPVSMRHNLAVLALTAAGLVWVGGLVRIPVLVIMAVAVVLFGLALSGDRASEALRSALLRIVIGLALVVAGLATTVEGGLMQVDRLLVVRLVIALIVVVAGLAVIALPTIVDLVQTARADRRARIRAEERADVAAHLHDSVLQTLTLIQNRADDPVAIAALAHQQERELRQWLYGHPDLSQPPTTFRGALERAAAQVEDQYLRAVECIVVGDCDLTEAASTMVAAAREAMINAAKFADVPVISVFAEVDDGSIRCFVRDRGIGFDLDGVPADRRGIADSIDARVDRCGGTAVIRTAPGSGTEVRLEVPR